MALKVAWRRNQPAVVMAWRRGEIMAKAGRGKKRQWRRAISGGSELKWRTK
jgi:hypothetical protein